MAVRNNGKGSLLSQGHRAAYTVMPKAETPPTMSSHQNRLGASTPFDLQSNTTALWYEHSTHHITSHLLIPQSTHPFPSAMVLLRSHDELRRVCVRHEIKKFVRCARTVFCSAS